MKVKCVDKKDYTFLTLGKIYDIMLEMTDKFFINDDDDDVFMYDKDCFIVVCETEEELKLENLMAIKEKEYKELEERLKEIEGEIEGLVIQRNIAICSTKDKN